MTELRDVLDQRGEFQRRHIGPGAEEIRQMLAALGKSSLDQLIGQAVPAGIRAQSALPLGEALTEAEALAAMRRLAQDNQVYRSYIGMGYYGTLTPPVIQRNILENPGWYTQYTPYQAEISQGRLEALLNFQTMVADLTGLPIANASLLDEATAAAEAMTLCQAARPKGARSVFFVAADCHPQTVAVIRTRAEPLAIEVVVGDPSSLDFSSGPQPFGILLQYPTTFGRIEDYEDLITKARKAGCLVTVATDLLALTLLKSPGELGADIAIGSAQRFGVPMGFGGPHAAFFATREEHKRRLPGRIIGLSKDAQGQAALRMALQTREQHIRRDKATSNICTSQVLLAIMASMYAVYHGPDGLKTIASRVHGLTQVLIKGLGRLGLKPTATAVFDTVTVKLGTKALATCLAALAEKAINVRKIDQETLGLSLDETTTLGDVDSLLDAFAAGAARTFKSADLVAGIDATFGLIPQSLRRTSAVLTHPVFHAHRSETAMLRYIRKLESRDLSLTRSMIPLGSCTMKLNATSELLPITWPQFGQLHPFVPKEQAKGYFQLFDQLERALKACTGFDGISLQPNSGAQGEYAGLLVIRKYHQDRGQGDRNICLIPKSAHGTNPASAVLAGMQVVVVDCDARGNIDVEDLSRRATEHRANLACLMVTYPSTHGVFEETITKICEIVHQHGGQVYMDGANMNAQVGLCRPGDFGPDVCHLNLHKTFCIPHGGGGPGMGPIGVKSHLVPYLPGHPVVTTGGSKATGPVSAAPWGSASILPISMMYIWMMGGKGLTKATEVAILNANYLAKRLDPHYPVLYRGQNDLVAHECIIDLRPLKTKTGIEVEDVAKRLMDYGFHAPTVSFPVPGTMMIEPTESESLAELDRFCEAMIAIREEIREIEAGRMDKVDNPLKRAPHTARDLMAVEWQRPYTRQVAVFPVKWVEENKFWPAVARVDSAFGDRNLVCTCPPLSAYE